IDFGLAQGGRVSGIVLGASGGLSGVSIQMFTDGGVFITSTLTNASGAYTSVGLPAGSVYVRTSNGLGYLDNLHATGSDVLCMSCNVTASGGTTVGINLGAIATVDFHLTQGGQITGFITDATTHAGIANIQVSVVDAVGRSLGTRSTASDGSYGTTGLPTGSYLIRAGAPSGSTYIAKMSDNLLCQPRSPNEGMPIEVRLG